MKIVLTEADFETMLQEWANDIADHIGLGLPIHWTAIMAPDVCYVRKATSVTYTSSNVRVSLSAEIYLPFKGEGPNANQT